VDEIARECDWFVNVLGPDVPLHFTAFHADFKMTDVPATPAETLVRARAQARRAGLKHVYTGNIHDPKGQSTYCASCGQCVIERDWYRLGSWHLTGEGACGFCGAALPGRFSGPPGTWGRKRRRLDLLTR